LQLNSTPMTLTKVGWAGIQT